MDIDAFRRDLDFDRVVDKIQNRPGDFRDSAFVPVRRAALVRHGVIPDQRKIDPPFVDAEHEDEHCNRQ